MKLDRFINRPVLSTVISVLIVILGVLGLVSLPITQFPDIAPPTIEVSTSYTGANAQTVLNSVIAPLEEAINGVENMDYMTSTATNTGDATIEITFKQDMTINCDDLGKLCRAAEEKRYTLRNNAETLKLKNILFLRTKSEMDAYHDMSRAPESNTPKEIERQRARVCSVWQVLEEAELVDEYDAWKCAGGGAK